MNISLIGMMGSGKTTVGLKLKNLLPDYSFIDTDEVIVKTENRNINDIFNSDGEEYFRHVESAILNEVLLSDNQIISTGGGIILSEENINILKQKSTVIYLRANANTLFLRVKNDKSRPLLNVSDMENKIKTLLSSRASKYEKAAHYILDAERKTPEALANEIKRIINE